MGEILRNFFLTITNNTKLITLFVSFFPLVELKGAIPIGTSLGLNTFTSFCLAYVGSTLISIPLYFLLVPVFNLLKKIKFVGKFFAKTESVLINKANKLAEKNSGKPENVKNKILALALFVFVAIPFPVTGVWTGTAIACFLKLPFKHSVLPLALGNLVAGLLITLLTLIFNVYVDIIIDVLFVIAIIMFIVFIVKIIKTKPQE